MKEATFVSKNENEWKALDSFNSRLKKQGGIRKLAVEEVREFARLFRLAGFHLAYAKTHYPHGTTVGYLNGLVGMSHNFFYVRERGTFAEIRDYFAYILPLTLRQTYRYWVVAAACFAFGLMFAAFYVVGDTARLGEIMPAGMGDAFTPGETPVLGEGLEYWDGSLMSAFFITNNTTVAFNAFALGLLGGIGSLFIMFYNGLVVGGLFGFLYSEGADMLVAYSLILPHGIIELMAIFLAGGCGLMLCKGILLPGKYTRRHALVLQARRAAKIIPAVVIMLVAAAFIEGFFTPLNIDPWYKIIFAALTAVGMIAYFLKGARL
ncbi:MAG: stage II sporulation protein M [Defluviitaleaceae bacterium]|nr:stage II sporulation protein M [Defluviitaleaceae bacterium]